MITVLWMVLALIGLLFSAFFSGAETGTYRVHPLRLRVLSDQGDRSARRLQSLLRDRAGLLAVTLIGTNTANYLTTLFTALLLTDLVVGLSPRAIEIYTTILLTPIVFVFGEIVPKNWFRQEADRLMLRCTRLLATFDWLLRRCGAVAVLKGLTHLALRYWPGNPGMDAAHNPRREVLFLLRESAAEGLMSEHQIELVDRILALSSVRVGSIMIPRERTVMLARDATRSEVLRTIRNHPHTRYPVYDAKPARVIGLLDAYEFLSSGEASIAEWLRQPIRLSAGASVSTTLRHMREARQTFGIVVDRWDNCIGVVTVKDLVEEIVGELAAW